jgi:hypothetical protein
MSARRRKLQEGELLRIWLQSSVGSAGCWTQSQLSQGEASGPAVWPGTWLCARMFGGTVEPAGRLAGLQRQIRRFPVRQAAGLGAALGCGRGHDLHALVEGHGAQFG